MAIMGRIAELNTQAYIPGRILNGDFIEQAYALMDQRKGEGVIPRSKKELRRMARRGNLVGLSVEENGERRLVAIGAITHEFRNRRFGRVRLAEFGGLTVDRDYESNGLGKKVVIETATRYVQSALKTLWRDPDFRLIAMAGTHNKASNGTFVGLKGILMDPKSLPDQVFNEGRDYNTYDITHLGRQQTASL
jgi:hypothetical protein